MSLSWIQISDLHVGAVGRTEQRHFLNAALMNDLGRLHDRSGPWDLLIITGDMTDCGADSQWEVAQEIVYGLRAHMAGLGSTPRIVVVPGNHDLDRRELSPSQRAELSRLSSHTAIRSELSWPGLSHLRRAFSPFMKFVATLSAANEPGADAGILPGDFRMTLSLEAANRGVRVGVLGLNTACRAACDSDGPYSGLVNTDQLSGACGWDPTGWFQSHDVVLLITHHSRSAIPPSALSVFDDGVLGQGLIHLCGHMGHAESGQPLLVQAPSCCGRPRWGQNRRRLMGYLAARIDFQENEHAGVLRRWPRLFWGGDEQLSVVADYSFELDSKESIAEPIALRKLSAEARAWKPRLPAEVTQPALLPPAPSGQLFGEVVDQASPDAVERKNTRLALQETLRTDSDFEAFCLDLFPWVYRRFGAGMDRTQKCNILLSAVGCNTVFRALSQLASPQTGHSWK